MSVEVDALEKDRSELAQEIREMDSATDGEITMGTIVEQPYKVDGLSDDRVKIDVETPFTSFSHKFAMPKPPLDECALYRVADQYGVGFTDLDALSGVTVPCRYDGGTWRIDVPEPEKTTRGRVSDFVLGIDLDGDALRSGGVAFHAAVGLIALGPMAPFTAAAVGYNYDGDDWLDATLGFFVGLFSFIMWFCVVAFVGII